MSPKIVLSLFIAFFMGIATSPVHAGDIISCDSFDNCPDGSVPLTNALLALQARMDALEADNTALAGLVTTLQQELAANTAADAAANHNRYTDAESIAAVGPHFSGSHADLTNIVADQHQSKYTDAEAVTAVGDHSPDFSTVLAGVSRITDPNTSQDTLRFTNMNVQIVSGSGATWGATTGTGNLIIGYNELRNESLAKVPCPSDVETERMCNRRGGSHMLVTGAQNNYTALSYGGMVVGQLNEISVRFGSVSGGYENTAIAPHASVSGGRRNTASGSYSSVSGGTNNRANATKSSISGGYGNTASGDSSSVSGGSDNTASEIEASVSGGFRNTASGRSSSISGGANNIANATNSSISGGKDNTASEIYSSISGGSNNIASGGTSSVSGGFGNTASGPFSSIGGGNSKTANTQDCTVGDDGIDC